LIFVNLFEIAARLLTIPFDGFAPLILRGHGWLGSKEVQQAGGDDFQFALGEPNDLDIVALDDASELPSRYPDRLGGDLNIQKYAIADFQAQFRKAIVFHRAHL
jgi:hypothetical protein